MNMILVWIKQAKDSGFNAYNVHVVLDEGI